MQGRKEDIGAFDTPKNPGQPIGWISKVTAEHLEITTDDPAAELHNGDGLCYYDLQKELVGLQINRAEAQKAKGVWRLFPKDPMDGFKDLRKGVQVNRNRDTRHQQCQNQHPRKSLGRHWFVLVVVLYLPLFPHIPDIFCLKFA